MGIFTLLHMGHGSNGSTTVGGSGGSRDPLTHDENNQISRITSITLVL